MTRGAIQGQPTLRSPACGVLRAEPLGELVDRDLAVAVVVTSGDELLELVVIEGDVPEPADETEIVNEKLISDKVEEVSAASISALTAALAGNMALRNGNQTLEQLIKEVLRPILKEWLDDNLPDIVERIVREEVKRIAQRAN